MLDNAQHKLRIYTPAGAWQHEWSDSRYVTYTKRVNEPGNLRFRIGADHPAAQYLVDKAQIEVLRRNPALGLDWYVDFVALFRDSDESQDDDGQDIIVADCPGIKHMLSWRKILWAAGTSNKTSFTSVKGESLLKALVTHNITSVATVANGRKRDGTLTGPATITVQADGAAGNTIASWACEWKTLLDELQAVAKVAGGDFDLVGEAGSSFVFTWFLGQRGTDRRTGANQVTFATNFKNISRPRLQRKRTTVYTSALVAGEGKSNLVRATTAVTGNGYVLGTNNIETFVDARNLASGTTLTDEGNARLAQYAQDERLEFGVKQLATCYYGIHYGVGDLVNVVYRDYEDEHKIKGVVVTYDERGGETIQVETDVWN